MICKKKRTFFAFFFLRFFLRARALGLHRNSETRQVMS